MTTTNEWTNPSFEVALVASGSGPTAWNSGTVTRETGDPMSTGDWFAEVTGAAGGDGAVFEQPHTALGEFTVSMNIWSPVSSPAWRITMYDQAFNELGATSTFSVEPAGSRVTLSFEAVLAHTELWAFLVRQDGTGADVVRVDALQLEAGTEATDYFDGDTADGGGFVYAWTGTPHDSTSTRDAVPSGSGIIIPLFAGRRRRR